MEVNEELRVSQGLMRHMLGCTAMVVVPKEMNGVRHVSSYPLVPAQNFHLGIYMGIDQSRESENAVGFPVVMGWDGMGRESPYQGWCSNSSGSRGKLLPCNGILTE